MLERLAHEYTTERGFNLTAHLPQLWHSMETNYHFELNFEF